MITLQCFVVTAPKWRHPPRNHRQQDTGLCCRGGKIDGPLSWLLIISSHCDPVILEHLSPTRSRSHPIIHPCLCVFVSAKCVYVCVCVRALASASFTLSQPLSHVSMNHNMQLNINHCIGFGASHAETLLILFRSRAPRRHKEEKNPLNSDIGWVLFSLVMLVYSITCSSDERSQSLVSKADGGNIKKTLRALIFCEPTLC